jgi:outer membrane protein
MKILQITVFTLILGTVAAFGQIPENKVEIAKNSADPGGKRPSVETAVGEEDTAAPAAPVEKRNSPILKRVGIASEQTVSMSLDDVIRKAIQNNNDIEVSKQNVKKAEYTLRGMFGLYDPVFTVTPNYNDNVQPVSSVFGGGDNTGSFSSRQFRVDSDMTHFIKPGGGSYRVFFNNSRTATSATSSQFTPTFDSGLGINFTQPLFRNFSIDAQRRAIRVQRKRVSQSDADFRTQTIDTIRLVQTTYWDLVFTLRDQQNKVENLNLSKENLRQVEARIKAGSSAPLARAEVLTELANREADVITAAEQVSRAENALKQLIIRDPNSPEWSDQITPTDRPAFGQDTIDLDAVVKDAIANRPELNRLRLEKDINDVDIKYFKNQLKPRIDLNASYSLTGLSGTPTGLTSSFMTPLISGDPQINANAFLLQQLQLLNPNINVPIITVNPATNPRFVGGLDRSLNNLFSNDFRAVNVGVTFSFPLRNTQAKADLGFAQAERTRIEADTRSREQGVITEVRNAVQALESARQRILTAQEGVKNAEIQLEGQRKLYELGRSDTFLLFQRENELAAARNALIRAETDYNKSLADLQRATSTTLAVNNIQIDSPVSTNK